MPGVKGRSGASGVSKSEAHRAAIASGVRAFWDTPEGQALRTAARVRRLERRVERAKEVRRGR